MNNGDVPTLTDAQQLLPDSVFLVIEPGTKKPVRRQWQQTTFEQTQKPGYQKHLALGETIGVLLGSPSNWISHLDCDTDAFLEFLLNNNNVLEQTLRTRGARAGGFWFRNLNHSLERVYALIVSPDSPLALGGKLVDGKVKIGELRCGHGYSIVAGLHPSHVNYRWLHTHAPINLDPCTLVWPEEIKDQLPWNKPQKKGASPKPTPSDSDDKALLEEAKGRLPIYPALWHHFGFPEPAGNPTNSPFRQDDHPSFSIFEEGHRAFDHGAQKSYDSFDFFQEATGKNAHQAFRKFVTLAGLEDRLRRKSGGGCTPQDPRPVLRHAGENRFISEFAEDLGRILRDHDFYQFRGRAVYVARIKEKARNGKEYETEKLVEISPTVFSGLIEKYCRPLRGEFFRSISVETAARTLPLPQFLDQLPLITCWADSRVPYMPYLEQMPIALSQPGYDPRTGIFTSSNAPEIDEQLSMTEAATAWRALLEEFCFIEELWERSIAVTLAAAISPFCFSLLPEKTRRPGFAATANAEGAGKTLLLSIGMVAKLGFIPTGATPTDEEEMRKIIDGAAHQGAQILFFDNMRGHLSSGSLEAFLTADTWRYRILGSTNYTENLNSATVYLTASFATYSSDLRRRLLAIELMLKESRAEERIIKYYLNEEKLIALRPKLLSIFWAFVRDWDQKGRPSGKVSLPTFETWSRIIGGIIENAGFVSPCSIINLKTGGDTYTQDMETLVSEMVPLTEYTFSQLIDLAYDHHLFPSMISDTGTITPSDRVRLGKLIRRFNGRTFQGRYLFQLQGFSRRTERFQVQRLAS